jgi:hypothetical protein
MIYTAVSKPNQDIRRKELTIPTSIVPLPDFFGKTFFRETAFFAWRGGRLPQVIY